MIKKVRNLFVARPLWFIIIALCAMGLGVFFRLIPLWQKGAPYARRLATVVVHAHFKQQVQSYVESAYPGLSARQKDTLTQRNYRRLLRQDPTRIQQMIDEGTQQLLANGLAKNTGYLLEADSYHFYGLTEKIRDTGSLSTAVKAGRYFEPLMLAPEGKWEPFSLHPYLGFYLYKLISFFAPGIAMIEAVKYLVIIIAALCVIPFLVVCAELGLPLVVSFVGAVFLVLAPFFTQRTAYGWYDTDVYSIFFPLVIFALLFSGLRRLSRPITSLLYALLAAFATGLYELFWHGWSFMAILMSVALVAVLIADHLCTQSALRRRVTAFYAVYLCGTFIWISVFVSPMAFVYTFQEGWKMLQSFLGTNVELWPNIFLTVGETQSTSLAKASFLVGGSYFFLSIALGGMLLFLIEALRTKRQYLNQACILACAMAILLYLTLKAVRFAVLLTVPASLAFTLALGYAWRLRGFLFEKARGCMSRIPSVLRPIIQSMPVIAFLALSAFPMYAANQIASRINPIYNATWEKVLRTLHTETPEESIINSWWCPGHFITAVAKRRVTVDGSSQQEPQTYWMATLLLSEDEKEAVGILRMLNTSGNKALTFLENKCGLTVSESIELLKTILPLSEPQARVLLLGRQFAPEVTDTLLALTHGRPPASYLLVYNELIDTYAALPYIGNWNFRKMEYLVLHRLEAKKNAAGLPERSTAIPSRDSKNYLDFILSLSGGIPDCSPQYAETYRNDTGLRRFENGLLIDLASKDTLLLSEDGKKFIRPKSLFYIENGELKEQGYAGETLAYSVLLVEKEKSSSVLLLDRSLARSLLFKLYYLKGKGLSHFTLFIDEQDPLSAMHILAYKIEW